MPAKKTTKSSDNKIETQQAPSQQTVAQVVVCEGERIWWLFLADKPLPEDAQIGKESTTEGSIHGWYLYPEPRIAGTAGDESSDFSFHKQGDANKKDETFFYGIIARDVPISRLENSKHKESWVLTKENRAFVDAAYAEFVEKERIARAEELKKREEAKRQKQMQRLLSGNSDEAKKGKKGGADKQKSAKNDEDGESEGEKESEQEAFAKHLREQMQGWEIVGKNKSSTSSSSSTATTNNEISPNQDAAVESTQESPQIKFHALLRVPTSLKEIESMFLFKNNNNIVVGSRSFFNELVIVGEEKTSATSWTRTVFVPVMSPSLVEFPESTSAKSSNNNNEAEENNSQVKDEHDFIISNHVQGKGKHSLLLALDESGDSAKNIKLGFARNAALVDKDYVQSLGKTFSNNNNEDASDFSNSPIDRFSQSLNFATRSGSSSSSSSKNQQQNILEFGTVFFAVCCLNVEHSIDEGEEDDKENNKSTLASFMIKNLDPTIVLSEEASSLLCLVPQFVVELAKSANSALRVILASYLVDQTSQQQKRKSAKKAIQKPIKENNSNKKKQQVKRKEKRRRQRDSDDESSSSSSSSSSSESDSDSSTSTTKSSNEESDDDDQDDDSENGNKKSRKTAAKKAVVSSSQKKLQQANNKIPEKLRKNAAVSVPPPTTKSKRNQKPLAQLLEELAPAVSSQSAIVANNNNNKNNSQKRTAATAEKELKQKKEDTRLELLSQLLADVGESVKMANNNNNNDDGEKEHNETASSSTTQQQQQLQTTSNSSQSTAYGNFGMSVVPEYGSW